MRQAVSGQSGGRSEFRKGRSLREAGRESEFAAANPQKQVPIIKVLNMALIAFSATGDIKL